MICTGEGVGNRGCFGGGGAHISIPPLDLVVLGMMTWHIPQKKFEPLCPVIDDVANILHGVDHNVAPDTNCQAPNLLGRVVAC